jgi:hypothetical protein
MKNEQVLEFSVSRAERGTPSRVRQPHLRLTTHEALTHPDVQLALAVCEGIAVIVRKKTWHEQLGRFIGNASDPGL